jgi:hypothetical protein
MLPPPTPLTEGKEKERDENNVAGLLMDLAEDGLEDGTSTPTAKVARMIPPVPTDNDTCTILPAPTDKDGNTTLPARTGNEAGTTLENPTNPKHQGTLKPNWPATPSSESSSCDDDNTEKEDYFT